MIKCPNCGSENLVYKGGATYMCTDCAEVTTFVIPYDYSREKVPVELVYEENKKLRELLKRVNEHFKWVNWDDNFYVNDELWDDIKKVLGEE